MIPENIPPKQQTNIPFLFLTPESHSLERENLNYIIRSYIAWEEPSSQRALSEREMESFISPVIKESESKSTLDEVFGLWKGRNISLDEIREQQWGRKTK